MRSGVIGCTGAFPLALALLRRKRREPVQFMQVHVHVAPGISSSMQVGHGSPVTRTILAQRKPLLPQLEQLRVGFELDVANGVVNGNLRRAITHSGHSQ